MDTSLPDLTGIRFHRLLVIGRVPRPAKRNARGQYWLCHCDCGGRLTTTTNRLRNRKAQSCGCLFRERRQQVITTHGRSSTPEYQIWNSMRQRCENPRDKAFRNYGGRGISVCPEWRHFEAFIADMGDRPNPSFTLERKETDGSYCKENCRWATRKDQQRNFRRNRIIEANGEKRCLAEWAEVTGLSYDCLMARVRRGWDPERAVNTPAKE